MANQDNNQDNTINYIEFPLVDAGETQRFYARVFGWEFTAWGENYLSFSGAGIDGGFNGEDGARATPPGVLIVLYAIDLEQKSADIAAAGGKITRPIYPFPGGRRFHFIDPNGTELAVWSS